VKEYTEEQSREAAEWFLLIHDSQDPPVELLQEWGRWLAASKGHRAAFEAVEQAYHLTVPSLVAPLTLGSATKSRGAAAEQAEDYDGSVSVADWLVARKQKREMQKPRALRRWMPPLAALAAGIAALALIPHWAAQRNAPIETASTGTFSTRTAEHKELLLPDGSRVTLGARSKLAIELGARTRAVHLEEGEAFFSVRKDPTRPFVVHAMDGVITAVGTAFNVRAMADQISVAVREGVVRVTAEDAASTPAPGSADTAVRLSIGEQLSFDAHARPPTAKNAAITHFDSEDVARWRDGWLVYRNEPLRYVIADVARYTDLDLEVGDGIGSDLRFSGAIFKDGVEEWIAALPRVFPVVVENKGSRRTIAPRAAAVTAER
jgi:transmembrane sensor